MGILGGVFALKSVLKILIWAPEVPFSVPPKTPKMGVLGHFIFFGQLPIEIPMHLQICIFRPQGVLKSKKFQKKPTLQFNFTLKNM